MLSCRAVALVAIAIIVGAVALPQQPADPVIGIITEPVAFGVCVTAEHHHLSSLKKTTMGGEGKGMRNQYGEEVSTSSLEALLKKNAEAGYQGLHSTNKKKSHNENTRLGDPTMPPNGNFSGCVWSIYVNWLQMSGIRVVPVPWNSDKAKLDWYFERVNGFMFPGGILGGKKKYVDEYFPTVQYIFDKTIAANARGDPMVMWGTCQGFELLNAAAARNYSVVESGFNGTDGPTMMANNFTEFATGSRMFADAPQHIKEYMSNYNTTLNWHSQGVTPQEFQTSSKWSNLREHLMPVTTTNDVTGRTFVSMVEGTKGYRLFGAQFHPERPVFEFDNDRIGHSLQAIKVSQYLSDFLSSQLRLNHHQFDTPEQVEQLAIANYPPHNDGWGIEVYYV